MPQHPKSLILSRIKKNLESSTVSFHFHQKIQHCVLHFDFPLTSFFWCTLKKTRDKKDTQNAFKKTRVKKDTLKKTRIKKDMLKKTRVKKDTLKKTREIVATYGCIINFQM